MMEQGAGRRLANPTKAASETIRGRFQLCTLACGSGTLVLTIQPEHADTSMFRGLRDSTLPLRHRHRVHTQPPGESNLGQAKLPAKIANRLDISNRNVGTHRRLLSEHERLSQDKELTATRPPRNPRLAEE